MTEIEHLLTDTLAALEQELRQTQKNQGTILTDQKQTMAIHANALHQLQQQMALLNAQQQESAQHLQRLSIIYADLEPLLKYLNKILSVMSKT
jgi:septal ring factor EnvC (AmiA/AmiB activator)